MVLEQDHTILISIQTSATVNRCQFQCCEKYYGGVILGNLEYVIVFTAVFPCPLLCNGIVVVAVLFNTVAISILGFFMGIIQGLIVDG